MRPLLRSDFTKDTVRNLDDVAKRCSNCRAPAQPGGKCKQCVATGIYEFVCPDCDQVLTDETIEYCARSDNGNEYAAWLPARQCPSCKRYYIYATFTDALDEFISSVPADLKIIPELGIHTSAFLEIFVGVDPNTSISIEGETTDKVTASIGEQSKLFQDCLDYITQHDTSDYGHDLSRTLRLEPGPPYSELQRREIHVLLSQLTRELGSPPLFWSFFFKPSDEGEDPYQKLADVVESWRLDQDRTALALVNKIAEGTAQGPFVNMFRLLELTLNRLTEDELERLRFDRNVSQKEFLDKIRSLQFDLASRLRLRVRSLSSQPTDILSKLWKVLIAGRSYSADEVFNIIIKLRNYNVHGPATTEEALRLPWEEIPFSTITEYLGHLVKEIITIYESDLSSRTI